MASKGNTAGGDETADGRLQGGLQRRVDKELTIRGMSAREAAVASGLSNTAWSKWLAGDKPPTLKVTLAVAQVLDWPKDWPTNLPPAPIGALEKLQSDVKQLTEMVREMSALLRDDLDGR